jgi:hypothetical protein
MSINFGASAFDATVPAGYLQESSFEVTQELNVIKNEDGAVAAILPKPRTKTVTQVQSKGDVALLTVAPEVWSGQQCTGAKISQTNDDFSLSSATFTLLQ